MNPLARSVVILAAVLSVLLGTAGYPQPNKFLKAVPGESDDRTLSPHFFVKSDDPQVDQLPLKSTRATVNISGVIADVVMEGLLKEVVLDVVKKGMAEIESCLRGGEPRAKLVIELILGPDGKVKAAKISGGPFRDKSAERCIIEQVKKWKFPPTQGSRDVKATVSLVVEAQRIDRGHGLRLTFQTHAALTVVPIHAIQPVSGKALSCPSYLPRNSPTGVRGWI